MAARPSSQSRRVGSKLWSDWSFSFPALWHALWPSWREHAAKLTIARCLLKIDEAPLAACKDLFY